MAVKGSSLYNQDKHIQALCEHVTLGKSLSNYCKKKNTPAVSTMLTWMINNPTYAEQYAHAREARADARADKIDDIVQQVLDKKIDPNAARVAIDAIKWQAGKEKPKRYGDKQTLDVNDITRQDESDLRSEFARLFSTAKSSNDNERARKTERATEN
jgi:hypothetical protein